MESAEEDGCCLILDLDAIDETKSNSGDLQKLEELVATTQAALEKEEKLRKEAEALNAKLIQEKTDLLRNLEGEKGSISSIQERNAKLAAQKADLESQLMVSTELTHILPQSQK